MMKKISGTLLVLGILASQATAGDLKAGAAIVEITPPVGMPMWGYAVRKATPSVGTRDPLFARAVVLDDGSSKLLIVALDLGRPPIRSSTARIRKRLQAQNINDLFMVATHTHHGPVMELENVPDANQPYIRVVEDRICEAAEKALKAAAPAQLSVAAKDCTLNRNRQSKRPDAPIDSTLTVLRIDSLDDQPIATLVNFAAHPTMLGAKLMEYSADWPGALSKRTQESTKAPCLFLQGASGDLTAKPRKAGTPEDFGNALAEEVQSLLTAKSNPVKQIRLRTAREEFQFACALPIHQPFVKLGLQAAFFPGIIDHYEREYRDGIRPEISMALLTDQIGLVGFSGEMFCGHALSLRRRARIDHLLICGCCNDYHQYFPTIEAMSETGYGTSPPIANAEPGAGERMTDRALLQLYRLRK